MNGFLLDTNVPSELIRGRPNLRVRGRSNRSTRASYRSVSCAGDFVTLPPSKRRIDLERWFENDLLPRFHSRILPVTHSIAEHLGVLDGQCQLNGTPLGTPDGMIAATAMEHDLVLVTRNVRDFAGLGVEVFNPRDGACRMR